MTPSSASEAIMHVHVTLGVVVALLGPAATPPSDDGLASLVDAERAFARAAREDGVRAAFLRYLEEDGVVFAPGPVAGRPLHRARPATEALLAWEPEEAATAVSRDLGYTFGPWTVHPDPAAEAAAAGHYISCWRRAGDDPWRVAVDIGVTHAPVAPRPLAAAPGGLPRRDDTADALDADRRFRETWAESGAAVAYTESAAEDLRVFRSGRLPLRGLRSALSAAITEPEPGPVADAIVSRSGDLACVWGEPGTHPASGFLRIWRHDEAGWRLVVDVAEPIVRDDDAGD